MFVRYLIKFHLTLFHETNILKDTASCNAITRYYVRPLEKRLENINIKYMKSGFSRYRDIGTDQQG